MDRTPQTNRVADTSSSSPPVQESPFSSFLSNLTPINTVKCESYTQLGNFLPTPPIVFATPHVDPHREKTFFERNDMGDAGSNADVYRECNMNIIDNSSFEKDGQLRDVSGCVDDYLADPARGDSTDSARLHVNPANEVPQLSLRGCTVSKQLNTQVLDVTSDSTKKESLESSNPAGNNMRSIQYIESKMNKTSDKGSGAYHSFSSVSGEESAISVDFVSRAQSHGQDPTNLQTAGYQYGEQNLIVQSHDDLHERKRKVSRGSLQDDNRGIRRHLQFETAIVNKSTTFGNNESLCSMSHDTTNLRSPPSNLTDLKNLYSSHVDNKASSDPTAVSCETLQLSSYPHGSVRSGQPGGNSSTSALVCSSIGLHLNSITRSTSMNSDVYSSRKSTGYVITTDQMLDHVNRNNIKDDSVSTFISAIPGKSYTCVGNGEQENHSLFTLYPSDGMPYLPSGSMHQMLVDQQLVPCEVGDASQDAKKVEELNQRSETKRERRGAEISDSCKRCNCKKSKCLKLYCECFAAGVFCLDSCACENCYNKPEFEDTVFDTRQQIESRNPLAFAPKVVKYEVDSSPNNMEQAHWTTPSSARHKRGCNCKKSKCLKKYCECFQANVGCSEACRCDCCQNPCGTKADLEYNHAEKWETQSSEKLDTIKGGNDCFKATIRNPYSPCWDGLSAISNATPISQTGLSTKVSSVSSSLRNCTKVSKSQRQSSRLQSSGTRRTKRDCSPITFTPVYESKGPYQLSSDGASHERMDDDTPEILEEDSISPLVVMAGSPNQKRVSPPQSRAERLRSSSHTGLRSGRKFTLKAVPSFPNLSPE